jgi:hypothetical protein
MPQREYATGIAPGAALSGVVRAFDATEWQADVQLTGSFPTNLTDIAVNRGLDAEAITAGRRCIVVFNDLQNPNDAVLVAVYA